MKLELYELYADGACQPNPGIGGWGFIIRSANCPEIEFCGSGSKENSTNNQMELQAVIEGLKYYRKYAPTVRIQPFSPAITLILDSKYVLDGISEWSSDWIKQDWKKKSGKPVLNAEKWKELLALTEGLFITFKHVKGHSGELMNERCDKLATMAIKKLKGKK